MTTSDEIIFSRRVRLLELAEELDNISAACRQLGVSRTRFYEWKAMAENYGLDAELAPQTSERAVEDVRAVFRSPKRIGETVAARR